MSTEGIETQNNENPLTMSHIQIAELTDKRKDSVKRTMESLENKEIITIERVNGTTEMPNGGSKEVMYYHVNEQDSLMVVGQINPEALLSLMSEWKVLKEKKEEITSLRISELTGKDHKHVMRTVRDLLSRGTYTEGDFTKLFRKDGKGILRPYQLIKGNLLKVVKERFFSGINTKSDKIKEKTALTTIEQLLNVRLKREYKVLKYRLDGYDPVNNVVYEIDEQQHFKNGELREECKQRQKEIEEELGCTFVRIKV